MMPKVSCSGLSTIVKPTDYAPAVPVIVVFTKYDQLVDLKIYDLDEPDEDEDILLIRGMREADIEFEETCVRPLKEIAEEVPFVKVSSRFHGNLDIVIRETSPVVCSS